MGPAVNGHYRSFGTLDTLNGALIELQGGVFYQIPFSNQLLVSMEVGGGWHRGAWTGEGGTFAQSELLAFGRFDGSYKLGVIDLLGGIEASVFIAESIIPQPNLEAGVGMELDGGWRIAAIAKGGFWSHPRDPDPFTFAPWTTLRLEARWLLKSELKRAETVSELESQFNLASVGDSLTVDTILFLPDSAELDEASLPVLQEILSFLLQSPFVALEIQGFANPVGQPEEELLLSNDRAEAVREWFISQGVDSKRLEAVGKGGERVNDNAEASRRVVFIIRSLEALD
jgi:outer membrane protein OmpA-like peptidoglycan-associated protein